MSIGQAPTKRVMVIYGTRPEAIKLAPVIRAIGDSSRLSPIITLTGQHRTIVDQVNRTFGICPDHDLDVIQPRQSLHGLTARVLERLSQALQQERPDAVVVQGIRLRRSPERSRHSTNASRWSMSRPACAPATFTRRSPKRPTAG